MTISENDWKRYIARLRAVDRKAVEAMQSWMDANPNADFDRMIERAYGLATVYGEASAALACEMYDALALAQGASVPPAEPAPTATPQETAKAVLGTVNNPHNTVPATVGRLTRQAGADTMLRNAARDGAEFAWIPSGDTCAFCLMLASRGWQRQSKKAAKTHAEHIHANCDCSYAVRFDGKSTVAGYDPEAIKAQYDAAEGSTPQEKMNSMRRAHDAEHREEINAQKRAAYARRTAKQNADIAEASGDKNVTTNTPTKPEKPVYGCRDVTQSWLSTATPNSHTIIEQRVFTQDGITYTVDGTHVLFDYDLQEKHTAELLEGWFGGDIRLMPRVNYPKNIDTPDYLFRGERYDLKTMSNATSRNAVYNKLNPSQRQADCFILDISNNPLGRSEIIRQSQEIFMSYNARGVKRIIIIENGEVVKIFERK